MQQCVEVTNLRELEEALELFGISEDRNKTSDNIWEKVFPLYYSTENGEVFCTDTSIGEKVPPKLYGVNTKLSTTPYTIMATYKVNPLYVGKTIDSYLQVVETREIYYKGDLFKKVKSTKLCYELSEEFGCGDIVSLKDPFMPSRWQEEKFKILCILSGRKKVEVLQIGVKDAVSINISSVYVSELLKKKISIKSQKESIEVQELDLSGIKKDITKFYNRKGYEIESYLYDGLERKIESKQKYIPYIFADKMNYVVGESESDRNIIIQKAPQFKEMVEKLESLGFSMEKDAEGIFNNSLFFNGKNRKVTSILASQKLGRFEPVYDFFKSTFAQKVVLSINPYEMVTASHYYNDTASELGGSCFRVDGCYHTSVWAYIGSKQTAILKLKDAKGDTSCRMWVSFDTSAKAIVFGRKYGSISRTQLKMVRLCLEKRFAEFLDLEDSWKYGTSPVVHPDYGSGFYWDDPIGIAQHSESSEYVRVLLGTALNKNGEESDSGEFDEESRYCECCDNRVVETRYLEYYSIEVCDDCIDSYYRWSDIKDDYVHEDDAIWIEDLDDYDFDTNAESYYKYEGSYYAEVPNYYVVDHYGDLVAIDDAYCCYFDDEYYSTDEDLVTVVLENGDTVTAHEGNVPEEEYRQCEDCGVYFHNNFEDRCPECKSLQVA